MLVTNMMTGAEPARMMDVKGKGQETPACVSYRAPANHEDFDLALHDSCPLTTHLLRVVGS